MVHKLRDLLCRYAGYVAFVFPAVVMHVFWSVWGILAWPLAKLGCDAKTIEEPYVLIVGPMYVSSKLGRNWNYYGCEPEEIYGDTLRIDRGAFAMRWSKDPTENLRGDESKSGPFKNVIIKE